MSIPSLSAPAVTPSFLSQAACRENIYTAPPGLFAGGESPFASTPPILNNGSWAGALLAPLAPLSLAISSVAQTIHGLAAATGFGGILQSASSASASESSGISQLLSGLGGIAGGSFMDLFGGIAGDLFQQFDIGGMIGDIASGAKKLFSKLF